MVEQIFISPQVKRSVIINNKVVYTSCVTSFVCTIKNLVKNRNSTFFHSALYHTETRVCLKYFANDYTNSESNLA